VFIGADHGHEGKLPPEPGQPVTATV